MLVYLDSSVLARSYLSDESGHATARALLDNSSHRFVSSSWTRVEVASALVRALAAGRLLDLQALLVTLAADTGSAGRITLLSLAAHQAEQRAIEIVLQHALRSLDALHLAVADLAARPIAPSGQPVGFATRDDAQAAAAEALGFVLV